MMSRAHTSRRSAFWPKLLSLIAHIALAAALVTGAGGPASAMPRAALGPLDEPAVIAEPTQVRAGRGGGGRMGHHGGGRPGHGGAGRPGYGGAGRPGHGRPGYGRPGVGRPGYGRPGYGRPGYGAWRRPYRWPPGGAIAAGAAIGVIGAAAAASWASAPPQPGLCWYYTDASRRNGFWDVCP